LCGKSCQGSTSILFAHGTEKHDNMAPVDAQMKKLHAIMPIFPLACANMEKQPWKMVK
jgi:hypothetical protein